MSADPQQGPRKPTPRDRPEVAAWKAAYQNLDDSALLALVPILTMVIEQTQPELDLLSKYETDHEAAVAFTAGHLAHAMALREQGIDVSDYLAQIEHSSDSDNTLRDNNPSGVTRRSSTCLTCSSDSGGS